jgi:hypothetical protein
MGIWFSDHRTIASTLVAAVVGAIGWSGHAATLPLTCGFLLVVLVQANRWAAYSVALAYYAASSWPLVPGAKAFFGPNSHLLFGLTLWLTASVLLAAPWGLLHFRTWPARFWSTPLALAATSLPPLGLIGWASPLTSAGMFFPGAGWLGIFALLILPAVIVRRPRRGLALAGALIALANGVHPGDPLPLPWWEAADTTFGRSELELPDPIRVFRNAEWIQQRALRSHGRVIVFPETVVPKWNAAAEAFWEPTLQTLAANGKTVILGTTVAVPASPRRLNSVIIRGASGHASFFQRVPVPISMWKPFSGSGFPLRLSGPGSIAMADERVGVLICYELLLTWPILSLSLEHPTILVGVANDYWASATSIPAIQRIALSAWARLFWLPKLMAVNT